MVGAYVDLKRYLLALTVDQRQSGGGYLMLVQK